MKHFFILLLVSSLYVSHASAQVVRGDGYQEVVVFPVRVKLVDDKNLPVKGAELVIFNPEKVAGKGVTNEQGQAMVLGIEDGDYDILFKLENGKNILFEKQWIQTTEENERLYTIPAKNNKPLKGKKHQDK